MSVSAYGKFYDKGLNDCYDTRLEPPTVHHTMTYSARDAKMSIQTRANDPAKIGEMVPLLYDELFICTNLPAPLRNISHVGRDVQVKGIMLFGSMDHGMTWAFQRWHLELGLDTAFYGELSKHVLTKLERQYGSKCRNACL